MNADDWFFTMFGIIGGFILSMASWWWLNHVLSPVLCTSPKLSRHPFPDYICGERIQFAIFNCTSRDVHEVRIRCTLHIPDMRKTGSHLKTTYRINSFSEMLFCIKSKKYHYLPILLNESVNFRRDVFPEKIKNKYQNKQLLISDIFTHYPDSYFTIRLLAKDAVSGASGFFESHRYTMDKIENGRFSRGFIINDCS